MIALPLEPDTLHGEIKALRELLQKWETRLDKTPIPGHDRPGTPEQLTAFVAPLRGELALVASRANALAEILDQI